MSSPHEEKRIQQLETRVYVDAAGTERCVVLARDDVLRFEDGWLHIYAEDKAVSYPAARINAVETRKRGAFPKASR